MTAASADVTAAFVEMSSKAPTVGQFVMDEKTAVDGELRDSGAEYATELAKVEETRFDTEARAAAEREEHKAVDAKRESQQAYAYKLSSAALSKALERKDKALADHLHDAQMMGDAKSTKTTFQKQVDAEKKSAMAANLALFNQVKLSNLDKKADADKYLSNEIQMVKDVEKKVADTLNLSRATFIEMAQKVLAHTANTLGTLRWNFGAKMQASTRARDTNQKQGLDYMKRGVSKKNAYTQQTGSIGEVLKKNSDRIKKEIKDVSDRHADDIALLTEKRHTELVESLEARNEIANAEIAKVATAKKTYQEKKKAQEAQHAVRQTARAALNKAQGAVNAAKSEQDRERTTAEAKKVDEDAASLTHYNSLMNHYTSEETRASEIIAREQDILSQVRGILENYSGADEASKVDKCNKEKSFYEKATVAARDQQDLCNEATVEAGHENAKLHGDVTVAGKDDGKDTTVTASAEADETTPLALSAKKKCSLAAALAEEAANMKKAYNACLATGASELSQALIEVQRLSQKYIGDTKKFNADNAADIKLALSALAKLDKGLGADYEEMQKQVAADRKKEGETLASKNDASLKAFEDTLAKYAANVKAKTGVRNTKRDAHRAEDVKWQTAQTAQNTAEATVRKTESEAEATTEAAEVAKLEADTKSENFYSTEKVKVDQIRLNDDTYLKKEYKAIGEIQNFVTKYINTRQTRTAEEVAAEEEGPSGPSGPPEPDCKISYTKKANFVYPKVISSKWNYTSLATAQAKCTTLPNCVGVTKDNNGYNLRDVSHKGHGWKGFNSWQRVNSCLR
jgi:hypothetical protein